MFYSPLRYPGGKNKLSAFIAKICIDNNIKGHYIEPYAGGASVALFLLFENFVERVTINDKDKSIFAFWYSVLNYTDQLCEMIEETELRDSINNFLLDHKYFFKVKRMVTAKNPYGIIHIIKKKRITGFYQFIKLV